jgi:hypothetical protein
MPYARSDKIVDPDQLFGQSRLLFGLYQNLFAASVQSIALRPEAFFGSTYICEEAFSQMVKGKAVPLQAWSGPECSRKLRFPDFKPRAQDGGKVVSLTHRPPLPPGNTTGTHFC